jgi:hypothetical protein
MDGGNASRVRARVWADDSAQGKRVQDDNSAWQRQVRAVRRSALASAGGSAGRKQPSNTEKEPIRQDRFLFRLALSPIDYFHRLTGEFN